MSNREQFAGGLFLCAGDKLAGMKWPQFSMEYAIALLTLLCALVAGLIALRRRPQFSLLALMLLTTAAAFVFALSLNVPVGKLALDDLARTANSRTVIELRIFVFGLLFAMLLAGIILILRERSRTKKQ